MPSKHRQYTIVIHNVNEKSQDIVKKYASQAKEYVMSIEPYPQGNGSHLHLFIQYPNPRSFKSVLNELERFKKRIVVPRPADESRDWGRIQLDVMRGRFSQANAYLQGETKDKPIGEVISQKPRTIDDAIIDMFKDLLSYENPISKNYIPRPHATDINEIISQARLKSQAIV
jgi:hypothetical protein